MKRYSIYAERTIGYTFEITAESEDEAIDLVYSGDIEPDYEDDDQYEIRSVDVLFDEDGEEE